MPQLAHLRKLQEMPAVAEMIAKLRHAG
jgi:hypothetical protein